MLLTGDMPASFNVKMCTRTDRRKDKLFLCCFCGIFIKKNINNLHRHEKLHGTEIKKYKCCAKKCVLTYTNKENYYAHWQKVHRDSVMPDCLQIVYEKPKLKKLFIKKSAAKPYIKNCKMPIDYEILQVLGLIQKASIKIVDPIAHCLKSNLFFGEFK